MSPDVVVVEWRSSWAEQFDSVAADLRAALGTVGSAVDEHVGSTSVPGLAAKPILDIDVIVDRGVQRGRAGSDQAPERRLNDVLRLARLSATQRAVAKS